MFHRNHWIQWQQDCIPVGCIPPACWPYVPPYTAQEACLLPGGEVPPWGGGLLRGLSQHALRQTPPPCGQNSWHTLLKILPCPKLRLRAVKILLLTKIIRTCSILCKRPRCYHSASKTRVTDRIFKLSPIHASVINQIPYNSLNFYSI